jgi:hypothetical protein
LGQPIVHDYPVILGPYPDVAGELVDQNNRRVGYFEKGRPLPTLKLGRGLPVGPHVLKKGEHYMLSMRWDDAERARWNAHQASLPTTANGSTEEEKAFLKKNFQSEFHFLRQHGLSIYKEEDREEGRSILRAMSNLASDYEDDDDDEKDEEDEDEEEDDEDNEQALMGHMTDYLFTEPELEFIEERWGNSMNFMYTHGLKFYNNEDCDWAKATVRALMADSDEEEDDSDDADGPVHEGADEL